MPSFAVLLALAALFTVVALVPSWRRRWGWGRGGSGGAISAAGWTGIVGTFLLLSAGLAAHTYHWFEEPLAAGALVLAGFVLFVTVGVADSLRGRGGRKGKRGG